MSVFSKFKPYTHNTQNTQNCTSEAPKWNCADCADIAHMFSKQNPTRYFHTCPQHSAGCFTCPHGNILAQHFCKLDTGFDHSLLEYLNIKTCHCGWNTQ